MQEREEGKGQFVVFGLSWMLGSVLQRPEQSNVYTISPTAMLYEETLLQYFRQVINR